MEWNGIGIGIGISIGIGIGIGIGMGIAKQPNQPAFNIYYINNNY